MNRDGRRLLVVTSRFPFGTQEAYLNVELAELIRHFDRVAVAPVRPPESPARHTVPDGVEVVAWGLADREVLWRALKIACRRPVRTARAVAGVLASRDPGRPRNAAVMLKALALAHWTVEHGYDRIHAYWTSTPATVAMVAAMIGDATWSATAHRWDIYERNAFDVKERNVAFVRTISKRGTTDLRARMPSLNGRVMELGLGISIAPMANPQQRTLQFRIVCPAALVPVKGHATLIEALARLRKMSIPVRCEFYGSGPLQEQLEAQARSLGIDDAVAFAGFVPQAQLHTEYREGRFAAMVLASRADGEAMMEGLPSAVLEAMAYGVPVVATDSGSIGEVIDGRTGHLVPAGDAYRLASALADIYRHPQAARQRAEFAHEIVSQRHDVRTQMRALAAAIEGKE